MGQHRIEFDVDFGLAFKESDIKKQAEKHKEKIIKSIENGEPLEFKFNVKNAIDDKGNPIDEASLKRFTAKYEKQVNSVLKNMMNSFSDKAMNKMTSEITKQLSSTIKELFASLSEEMINGFEDMKSKAISHTGKPIHIEGSDIIEVDAKSVEGELKKGSKTIKKASDKFVDDVHKAFIELEQAKKEQRKAKKQTDKNYEIDGTIFNDNEIEKLQKNEKEAEKVLKDLGLKFQKAYDEYLDIDDDDDSEETQKLLKKLENRQKSIATVISRFNNNSKYIKPDLFGEYGQDYIDGINEFADDSSTAIRKAAEKNVKDKQAYFDYLKQDPKFKALGLEKSIIDEKSGSAKLKLEPTVNATKFINSVFNAIEAIEEKIKNKPIEIPIKPESESIGGFLEDIRESLFNNPFDLQINKDNIVEQIKEAAKSINVELGSATISNVSANNVQSTTTSISSISDDEFEMYEAWAEINNDLGELSSNELDEFKNLISGTIDETQKLESSIEGVVSELNSVSEKQEVVKKTAKEIADVLVGETEISENQVIKELDDKIKVYTEVLDDLRRKKDVTTTSKPLDGGIKESELLKKKDKTDEDKERLNLLKQEREYRNAIRKEWLQLQPVLNSINNAQTRMDGFIDGYGKKLKELTNLRSQKHLTKDQKNILEELEKQEKELLRQKEADERIIQKEKERLEIVKKTSSYFGDMSNSTLLDLEKDVYGDLSSKKLIEKAMTNRSAEINNNYISQKYKSSYDSSKKEITQGNNKKLSPLMMEKKDLENTANLWQGVNALIEDKGKEKALATVNYELQQVNKEIGITQSKLATAQQNLINGVYTPSRYAEVEQEIKYEQKLLYDRRKELNNAANIIKYNSEEEIRIKTEQHKANLDLFNKDIASEEGKNKRIDQLRYKDLQSFAQYVYQYNKQKERLAKDSSYNEQLSPIISNLKAEGMSEKDAKNEALKQLNIANEYYDNKKAIAIYRQEFNNLELDLNEIIRLMKEINSLNDELAQDNLPSDVVSNKKKELSGKRLALETLVKRTGWQSNDILGYQSMQNYLNGKESKSSPAISKKADINQFNKDTTTIKEIVDNINVELDKAVKENKELTDSVSASERKLESIKEGISAKHQDDAKRILDQINELREQRKILKAEINNSTDEVEKEIKKQEVGKINRRLKGLEYHYNQANNPALLQSKIDTEYDAQTRHIQQQVNAKKAQIIANNDYIDSLKNLKKEQEDLRKEKEPTSQELSTNKRKVNATYKKDVAKIDSTINQLEAEVSKAQSDLDIVSKSAGESLEKINAELEKETENLKNLQNVEASTTSELKHSSIYQEYLDEQKPIQEKIMQDSKELVANNQKKEELQKKINNLMESYGVETEEQLKMELERQKVFQEIISLQEKINRRTPLARGGNKNAIKDIENYKSQINNMSEQLGFNNEDLQNFILLKNNASSIQDRINNYNRNSKIVNLERSISERINKGEGNTDEVKNLQIALEKLVKDDKNEQELLKLKSELKKIESEMSSIINRIGKKNAEDYFKVLNNSNDYTNIINDVHNFSEKKGKLEEENNILSSSIKENEKVLQKSNAEYILKLSQALAEETTQYNNELIKSGDLTEEAEAHLLNMVRYMDELEDVSGKGITFSDYGIDSKTFKMMTQILKENQEMDSNISKSEANYEAKQQQKIKAQEKIVASLKSQKEEQEKAIYNVQKEVEQKQRALEVAKQEREVLEETHRLEVATIDERRKAMKQVASQSKTEHQTEVLSGTDVTASSQIKEELKETRAEAEKTETELSSLIKYWNNVNKDKINSGLDVNENAAYFNVQSGQITSYVEGEASHLSQELIDSIVNSAKIAINGAIHTHGDWNKAAFSVGDLKTAYNDVLRGIKTQILMSLDEVMTLDLNGVKGYDLADIISEYEVRGNEAKERLTREGISDINTLQVEFQKILKELFDAKGLSQHLKLVSVQDYLKQNKPVGSDFKPTMLGIDKTPLLSSNEYSGKDIVSETDAIKNAQEELGNVAKETNGILDEQIRPEATTLPPSPIEQQQEDIKAKALETNNVLQEQIALAIQNANVSIADGANVNISGNVKIDETQWSGIDNITSSAEELLNVVKNIYLSISNGTPQVTSQLNAVQAPIENISAQIQQVEGAVSQADVQLKSFGNSIKAVSTGNLDLGKKEFKYVQEAVEAMNKALENNKALSKIQSSGDITAKYFTEVDEDDNIQSFVKFNTVFKDTNGQVIKATYIYDVLNKQLSEAEQITAKVSDKFTQQEKAMKLASSQLNYYTSQLDKLLIKYDTFDIKDFGIDDDGNLFANVGTRAEQIYDVISGNTKRAIKDVILYRQEVEEAFRILKYNSENGLYTETTFKEATDNFNKMVANFESKMNTVNRNMNTATEKNARSLLGKWQNELDAQISWIYNIDDAGNKIVREDRNSNLNASGLEYIEKYKQSLIELESLYKSFVEQGEYFTESQILSWKSQMQTISDIKKVINSNASQKYVNGKGYSIDGLSIDSSVFNEMSSNSNYARQVLSELAREINGVEVEVIELSKDNKTLTYSFKDANKNIQTCKLSVDDFGNTIRNTVAKSSQHVGLFSKMFNSLKDKLLQIFKYVSAYEIFYKAVNAIRSGIEVVKELDLAMTEMKKVTHESQQALDDFAKSTHKIAQEIGSTASTIQNSAADWMKGNLLSRYMVTCK